MPLEPRGALGVVPDVDALGADVVDQLPQAEAVGRDVAARHAQVAVLVVVPLQVPLGVLPHGVALVRDPSARLEPCDALGVAVPEAGPKREREEEEAPEEPPRFAPMTKAEKRRKKAAAPVPDPDARLSAKPNRIVDAE